MGKTNLQAWKDLGLVADSTREGDFRSGRIKKAPLQPQAKPQRSKIGPEDYLHHAKVFVMAAGFPEPETDYVFLSLEERQAIADALGWELGDPRMLEKAWELDLAWPTCRIALELHGGVNDTRRRGRHVRAKGFTEDRVKMNVAQIWGWIVLEIVCPTYLGTALKWLREAFALRGVQL